jgi:hypothetical protein
MTSQRDDLTISQLLSDPLIRAMMKADHVDLQAFEALLRSLARRLDAEVDEPVAARPTLNGSPERNGAMPPGRRLAFFDCCRASSTPKPAQATIAAKSRREACGSSNSW